jgi:hypothetical protein
MMLNNKLTSVHGGTYMKHWFINENYKRVATRANCYVYDSMVDPMNIDFIVEKFPNSYNILPSRNLSKWILSVLYHFKYTIETINGFIIYEFLNRRNNYYKKIDELNKNNKIKNYLFLDIDKDNILDKLNNFLPDEYLKYNKSYPRINITSSEIKTNLNEFTHILLNTLKYLEIDPNYYNTNWIAEIKNKNITEEELKNINFENINI